MNEREMDELTKMQVRYEDKISRQADALTRFWQFIESQDLVNEYAEWAADRNEDE